MQPRSTLSLIFKMLEIGEHVLRAYLRVKWASAWHHSSTTTILFSLLQCGRRSKSVWNADARQFQISGSVWGRVRCLSIWLISLRDISRLRAIDVRCSCAESLGGQNRAALPHTTLATSSYYSCQSNPFCYPNICCEHCCLHSCSRHICVFIFRRRRTP
jgi:hypothetical protein